MGMKILNRLAIGYLLVVLLVGGFRIVKLLVGRATFTTITAVPMHYYFIIELALICGALVLGFIVYELCKRYIKKNSSAK